MKKIFALMLVVICLSSCGNTAPENAVGVDNLANSIALSLDFEDELMPIDKEMAFYIHDVEDSVKDIAVYMGSGATAEEVAVFEVKNKTAMKEVKDELAEYIEDKRDEYEDYIPEEVARINKVVIVENGNYLVFCINEDSEKTRNLIETYLKGE